jgi:TRAP-type uncharacterized transport system fused permease subunit
MARERDEDQDDVVLDRPNRRKSSSKATRAVVVLLLLVSIVLMVVLTIGGWGKLQGAKPIQIAFILVYAILAFYIARWNRGALPMAAALAILLGIFAAISGPAWFQRDHPGFATPESVFGGGGLDESMLGLLTLLMVPVQVLLIGFAMQGFRQEWQVEVEVPADEAGEHGGAAPAAA